MPISLEFVRVSSSVNVISQVTSNQCSPIIVSLTDSGGLERFAWFVRNPELVFAIKRLYALEPKSPSLAVVVQKD